MKKKLLVCFVTVLAVLTLAGCGKKEDKNLKEIVLSDEGYGKTVFKYNQDKDYVEKDVTGGRYSEKRITSESENFVMTIYHTDSYEESYKAGKENRRQSPGFKEYTWNGLDGYIYNSDKYSVSFNVLLKATSDKAYVLYGDVMAIDYNKADVLNFFTSDEFQKFMNSVTFSE